MNVTLFVSGTFDVFNFMCKHKSGLNPILNGTINDDVDGTCKRSLRAEVLHWRWSGMIGSTVESVDVRACVWVRARVKVIICCYEEILRMN